MSAVPEWLEQEHAERARRPFAIEPVRTLDAIHLASTLIAQKVLPGLAVLSLDVRVREVAGRLGFVLLPSEEDLGN